MSEHFDYVDSPYTDFIPPDEPDRDFDGKHNAVTYHGGEVENTTGEAVGDVFVTLPYLWAVVLPPGVPPDDDVPPPPTDFGDPGFVALDFEDGAWRAEDFNGIEGLDLKVTVKIVPLDHDYTTGSIAAGSIASDASLTDVFGPSSADPPLEAPLPLETLDGDDLIPSVNLGELEPHEDVALDLVYTYKWELDGKKVDYDALRTTGYVATLDPVEDSNAHPTAGAVDDLWL